MPPKPPSLYDLKKTTIWFSIASLVLLIGLVMMVLQDSTREWKGWQRRFIEYSREKAEKQLHETAQKVDQKKLAELKEKLAQAGSAARAQEKAQDALRADLTAIEIELTKAKAAYQDLKQVQDSERYFYEEYHHQDRKKLADDYAKRMAERAPRLEAARLKQEEIEARRDARQAELDQFTEAQKQAEREMRALTQDADRVESKISKLEPKWYNAILNAPMLDFIRPTLQIQQIVVEKLEDDFYFSRVEKVDRCVSCHLAIDQKGFEEAPQPFRTHPDLDLYLSSESPHAMEEFGCTVCHGGSGHSISFVTAAHTPRSAEQAEEWEKKYHWHPMKHWAEKMLPLNHVQASCAKCHTGVVEVPKADKLNEGRHLAEVSGCFGCHKVQGFENRWKVGPSLQHVQSKLDQDWIVRWLQDPHEFRASTKMPRIFHLTNTSDPDSKVKNNAAIAGITAYLIRNSDPVSLQAPPEGGLAETGEKLVKELGCLGCHTAGGLAANDHGPELSGLGSKVKPEWLFTWLKNPKHYTPDTRMPDLRLTDEEAAHITAYLLAQRNEKFESLQLPQVDTAAVDGMAMTFLQGRMRHEEARAELEKMNSEARLEFVGKQTIAQMGCYGCHDIKGFEDAKPVGTELTYEGSKEVEKLDFGFSSIPRTRQAWFFQKLKEPRIFDHGKEKAYHEKLRMPQFDFTDEQAEALTTFILSLQKVEIPLEMQRRLSQEDVKVEAGRLLVKKFNCQGCHTLDGKEGLVRSIIEDPGNAPPMIDGEGRKVQPEWLYRFLQKPETIRPWLHYRMPSFGFDDAHMTALVEYFNALDQAAPSFKPGHAAVPPDEIHAGRSLFKSFQCIKCHQSNPDSSLSASFLAPDLAMSKDRLRAEWVLDWLKDPQAIHRGTMMPAFFPEGQSPVQDVMNGDAARQIKAMRDYLWIFTPEEAETVKQASPGKAA